MDILLRRYKPGSLSAVPSVVVPHQPRLDWQMWFAALSNYQRDGWIINLADKIMEVRVLVCVCVLVQTVVDPCKIGLSALGCSSPVLHCCSMGS